MRLSALDRYAHSSNYFSLLFVWCVWVRSSRPCISCLPWLSLFRLACACALLVWLPFLGAAGLLSFVAAARCFIVVVVFLLFALVAWCLRFGPLFPVPPSLPFVSWCFLVQLVFCWSLPPDIWLYLQRSGCHTFGMACRVDWLLSSLRSLATKASALCGLCPLHHVVVLFMCPSLRR